MRWRAGWAAAFTAWCLLAAAGQAHADSLTWGYNYQRDRVTVAPIAADAVLPAPSAPAGTAPAGPTVAALPGGSESTPVVFHGRWYLWTYWSSGSRGALWTGLLGAGGTTSPGTTVTLPGEASPVLQALGGEQLDEPADAAISPGGRWVAFSVGKYLYWWPAGRPDLGVRVVISGVEPTEATSTSPTFVPDGHVRSGWAVCAADWDGAMDCFAVDLGVFHLPMATYLVTTTTPADGDGYTPITSSAAYDPGTGDVYFGVASWHLPRVIRMDPMTGRFQVFDGRDCGCPAQVAAPVAAAVAVMGGGVYATDVEGDVYRFDAGTGTLTAAFAPTAAGAARQVDVVSPAVAARAVFVAEDGYQQIVALDPQTLSLAGRWSVAAAGDQSSAVTVVEDPGAPDELFYGLEGGGVGVALPACLLTRAGGGACPARPVALTPLYQWPGAPTDSGGYDFTAPVVNGADVLLWSDSAAASWRARGVPVHPAPRVPGGPGGAAGGLQVYRLDPRLTVFAAAGDTASPASAPAVATVGGPAPGLYVMQAPGARVTAQVAGPGGTAAQVVLAPNPALAGGAPPCPAGSAPNAYFGAFPDAADVWPASGCGPLSRDYAALQAYAAGQRGLARPSVAGMSPSTWRDAGVGYDVWSGTLPTPAAVGDYTVSVSSALPDGQSASAVVWYRAVCPAGFGADAGGRCSVCLGPPACPPCPVAAGGAGPGACGATLTTCSTAGCDGAACPSGVAPGAGGMTASEFALLCRPVPAWLTDAAVGACYGGWWPWVRSGAGAHSCGGG